MGNAYNSISQGLREAIAFSGGKMTDARAYYPEEIDVAQLRRNLGLTQVEFATKFCISLGTLRHWERGDRKPRGPALVLLHIVAKEPKAVLRALR